MELPPDITTAITSKREPSSNAEEQPVTPAEKPEEKAVTPEQKKDEAPKPKNGQSIAQIAEAVSEELDDLDKDDPDGGDHAKSKKRSNIFQEFLDNKRELKETKREVKTMAKQQFEMGTLVSDLIEVVKGLKGGANQKADELDTFAEENGLDPEGLKQLAGIIEKRLSTKTKPKVDEDEDDDDDTPAPKVSKQKSNVNAEMQLRKVELAIESEYEDYLDSFPQAKGKLNLKAIKQYIIGDNENLSRQFSDIVAEMYPGLLVNKAGVDGGSDAKATHEDDEAVDWNDPKVQTRMLTDKKLRDKYNEDLTNRVKGIYQ